MTPTDKQRIKALLPAVSAQIQASRSLIAVPTSPAIAPPGGGPVVLTAAVAPIQQALKAQADALEKLAKLISDLIELS